MKGKKPKRVGSAKGKAVGKAAQLPTPAELKATLNNIRSQIGMEVRAVTDLATALEILVETCTNEGERTKYRESLDCIHYWLCDILFTANTAVTQRARRTGNAGLIGFAAYNCGISDLPDLLELLPESEWDAPESSDCTGFHLLDNLARVIRFVERDTLAHPERYRLWAREQPALPMMVFRNVRAYQRRFDRIAAAVNMGERCPINSDNRANYDLSKPVNSLVFDALMEFMRVLAFLRDERPAWQGKPPNAILTEYADVPAAQVPVFIAAHKLPPLTKSTAYQWAYKAIIPYLEAEHPDWRNVPALNPYIKPNGGRSKAKEVIAERLEGMARPHVPEKSPSSRWPS
jgi:hypothetical protein